MKLFLYKQVRTILFSVIVLVTGFCVAAMAAVVEPASEGKFRTSKGTKAEEVYDNQGRSGTAGYEYGKGFKAGPVLFRPGIEYNYTWDNNIFFAPSNRSSDFIHQVVPSVDAELPLGGGQHLLTGGYTAIMEYFQRNDDQDHIDHILTAGGNFNFVPFSLSVDDSLRKTVDRSDTEFTSRITRRENFAHALLEIPFAQFFVETEVFDLDVNYQHPEDSTFDHHDFTVYPRVGFDVAPSTQLLAEYGYKWIDYRKTDNRDGDAHQFMVGLRGALGSRTSYQVWNGIQLRTYEADFQPDFHNYVMRGALSYTLTETSSIVVKGDVSPQESTFDNQNFYVRQRLEIGWRQQIRERLFFNLREILNHHDYSRITERLGESKTRRDWVWESAVGLEYKMPNDIVSIFGEYKFSTRESNLTLLDYEDHALTGGIKAKF